MKPKVLVLGDVGVDKTRVGRPTRLSPESSHTPVLELVDAFSRLGMAANVAANIVEAGCDVSLYGAIGCSGQDYDEDGRWLDHRLSRLGIVSRLYGDCGRVTTVKTRTVTDAGILICREDLEDAHHVFSVDHGFEQSCPAFTAEIAEASAIVLSDYGKGFLDEDTCQYILQLAHEYRLPVIADPKKADWHKFRGDRVYLTPNLAELKLFTSAYLDEKTTRRLLHDPHTTSMSLRNSVHAAAIGAMCEVGLSGVVTTVGKAGAICSLNATSCQHLRDRPVEVADVCGAGDVIVARLAAGVAQLAVKRRVWEGNTQPIGVYDDLVSDSLRDAVLAATIAVQQPGVTVVTADAMRNEMARRHWRFSECMDKVYPQYQDAMCSHKYWWQEMKKNRESGATIIFTNGCYDLLHAGHIHTLQWARWQSDNPYLIVGMNSDASVASLKGEGRPIIGQHDRAYCLAALSCVDMVIVFDALDVKQLLTDILPDVYVKGGEFEESGVPHSKIVTDNGGRMEYAPYQPNHSTSGILKKITHNR